MIGHTIIYSLRTDAKGLPQIDYKFGNRILMEDKTHIKIELPTEITTLSKSHYLNPHYRKNFVVYDNGDVFLIVCTKHVTTKYAFDVLMSYAIKKIDQRVNELAIPFNQFKQRIDKLQGLKDEYSKMIKTGKLVAA